MYTLRQGTRQNHGHRTLFMCSYHQILQLEEISFIYKVKSENKQEKHIKFLLKGYSSVTDQNFLP